VESRQLDDAELVLRAQHGDVAAYEELMRMYQRLAFRTAYVLAETGRTAGARTALATAALLRARPDEAYEAPLVIGLVERALGTLFSADVARRSEERRGALVATPGEYLRARESSRPGRNPG